MSASFYRGARRRSVGDPRCAAVATLLLILILLSGETARRLRPSVDD